MTTEQETAWFAGVFEGEGSVYLRKFVRGKAKTLHVHGSFAIEMTDEDVIQRVLEITGVGSVRECCPRGLGKKTTWRWQVQGREGFIKVADMLRPFLGQRRLAKLWEVESKLTWREAWWRAGMANDQLQNTGAK